MTRQKKNKKTNINIDESLPNDFDIEALPQTEEEIADGMTSFKITPIQNNESKEEIVIENKPLLDPEKPELNEVTIKQISAMLSQAREWLSTMESVWVDHCRKNNILSQQMRQVHILNNENRVILSDQATEEDKKSYDPLNGINKITVEQSTEIFGDNSSIINKDHNITISNIKVAFDMYTSHLTAMVNYRKLHDSYLELMEIEEDKNLKLLFEEIQIEEDPIKKAKKQEAYDKYYYLKYLDFLSESLPKDKLNHIVKAFSDEKQIEYWIRRGSDKLAQLNISSRFIMEVGDFEKNFLEEKYHNQNNILLLYFLNKIIYSDTKNKNDTNRAQAVVFILEMDKYIRGNIKDPVIKEKILKNILILEDQFINKFIEIENEKEKRIKDENEKFESTKINLKL